MLLLLNKLKKVKFFKLVIQSSLLPSVRKVNTYNAGALRLGLLAPIKTFLSAQPLASNCIIHGLLYTGSEFLQQTIMLIGTEGEEGEDRGYDTGPILR